MSLCQPVIWSMAAILRDPTVVVVVVVAATVVVAAAVVRTRLRAILLAMITMRKSTHGFPFVSHIWVAYGAPLLRNKPAARLQTVCFSFKTVNKTTFYDKVVDVAMGFP